MEEYGGHMFGVFYFGEGNPGREPIAIFRSREDAEEWIGFRDETCPRFDRCLTVVQATEIRGGYFTDEEDSQ